MGTYVDMTGRRCGDLRVVRDVGRSPAGQVLWHCRCKCGGTTIATGGALRTGNTSSCGCRQFDGLKPNHTLRHGHTRLGWQSPTYISWAAMHARCRRPHGAKNQCYADVRVCKRWQSFDNFLKDMGVRPADRQLDRINPWGIYKPSNCRWATKLQQARNKRRMILA